MGSYFVLIMFIDKQGWGREKVYILRAGRGGGGFEVFLMFKIIIPLNLVKTDQLHDTDTALINQSFLTTYMK